MKFQKQKFLTLVLVAALTLSLAACDGTYEPGEGMTTYIDTNYEGPSASDYANEGIANAKENGLYHETDYSSIQANGSSQNKNDDAEIGESAANPGQEPSNAGSNAENTGQASENPGQNDSGMGQETGNPGQSTDKDSGNSGVSSKDEELTRNMMKSLLSTYGTMSLTLRTRIWSVRVPLNLTASLTSLDASASHLHLLMSPWRRKPVKSAATSAP